MGDNLTPDQRRACMQAVKSEHTTPERAVRSMLHKLGCRFALHRDDLPGTPDVVMPARRSVVLIHGCFWHQHSCRSGRKKPRTNAKYWQDKLRGNSARDKKMVVALRDAGWRVLVVWECETRDRDKLIRRLSRFLDVKPT